MSVPAFQQQEVCNFHVMPEGSHLFELTSHMHQRGKRWRTFAARFRCDGERDARNQPIACDPLSPTQCSAGVACTDPDGRDPMASLVYTNFLYNDPVQLRFNPPLLFSGNQAARTLTYCALYDNGFTDPSDGEAAVDLAADALRHLDLPAGDPLHRRPAARGVQRRHRRGTPALLRFHSRGRRRPAATPAR